VTYPARGSLARVVVGEGEEHAHRELHVVEVAVLPGAAQRAPHAMAQVPARSPAVRLRIAAAVPRAIAVVCMRKVRARLFEAVREQAEHQRVALVLGALEDVPHEVEIGHGERHERKLLEHGGPHGGRVDHVRDVDRAPRLGSGGGEVLAQRGRERVAVAARGRRLEGQRERGDHVRRELGA